jgi:hypothetical protein
LTTHFIEAVHLVPGASPKAHEHIESVKLTTGEGVLRSAVISGLRAGDLYFTNASPPAAVYAHVCPFCGASDYITTIPDSTTANNLLSLPRFSPPYPSRPACPISWQPSVLAPVFYGIRDYSTADGAPGPCRVFFPSLDGAVWSAPILEGCGRYPLVLFAHGQCGEPEHYKKWDLLPAQLARSGYIVAVPELVHTAGGTEPWTDPNPDLQRLLDVATWMRSGSGWQYHSVLMPAPSTGVVGHSYGALLAARVAAGGSISAYASLSGVWHEWQPPLPEPIRTLAIPKLFTWGSGSISDVEADLGPAAGSAWSAIAEPKHRAVFTQAEHWDYLRAGRTTCDGGRGPCSLVAALAGDILCTFFGRYLPPEDWATLSPVIPDSLLPPTLSLTPEQESFAGGHLTGFSRIADPAFATVCGVTLGWGGTHSIAKP